MVVGLHMHVRGACECCIDGRGGVWVVGGMLMGGWMGGLKDWWRWGGVGRRGTREEGKEGKRLKKTN